MSEFVQIDILLITKAWINWSLWGNIMYLHLIDSNIYSYVFCFFLSYDLWNVLSSKVNWCRIWVTAMDLKSKQQKRVHHSPIKLPSISFSSLSSFAVLSKVSKTIQKKNFSLSLVNQSMACADTSHAWTERMERKKMTHEKSLLAARKLELVIVFMLCAVESIFCCCCFSLHLWRVCMATMSNELYLRAVKCQCKFPLENPHISDSFVLYFISLLFMARHGDDVRESP